MISIFDDLGAMICCDEMKCTFCSEVNLRAVRDLVPLSSRIWVLAVHESPIPVTVASLP